MSVPTSQIEVLNNGIALVDSPQTTLYAVIGCSTDGPLMSPRQVSYSSLLETFEAGPAVKAAAYCLAQTDTNVFFVRVPATAVSAVKTLDVSEKTGTSVVTVPGTATDSYEFVITIVNGGTIGTPGITYTISQDGGETVSNTTALGSATTIASGGITFTFAAGTLVTGDVIRLFTYPASESIYAYSATATGTATVDFTGTPIDSYEIRFEVIEGGEIGVEGITYRYSLDAGRTFTDVMRLGTAESVELMDYENISTGVTVSFANVTDTLDATDVFTCKTYGPQCQASDVNDALQALEDNVSFAGKYNFVQVVSDFGFAAVNSVASKLNSLYQESTFTHGLFQTRQIGASESDDHFNAEMTTFRNNVADNRVSVGARHGKIQDPVGGHILWRNAIWSAPARLVSRPIAEELGRKLTGALPSDVSISNDEGEIVEYDARVDSVLHDLGFVTYRTYKGETGIYFTRGNIMSPAGSDFKVIAHRRVMDLASKIFQKVGEMQILNGLRLNASTGYILEKDARKLDRDLLSALEENLADSVSGIQAKFNRNDVLTGANPTLRAKVRIVPLGYVGDFRGEIGFVAKLPQTQEV